MRTLCTFAVFMLGATALSGWTTYSAAPNCGPSLVASDPQLRATLAAFDRTRNPEFMQVCVLYRSSVEASGAASGKR